MLKNLQSSGEKKYIKTKMADEKRMIKRNKKYKKEESNLVKACMEYLKYTGYLAIRNNSGLIILNSNNKNRAIKMGAIGAFDIIACSTKGKFVAIECKSKNGKLSKKQEEFMNKVRKLGGIAIVVRSLEDLMYQLPID